MFTVSVGGMAGGPSQSMAAFAASSIVSPVSRSSSVAGARIESPSSMSRAAALDELFAPDDAVYNRIDSAAANPFAGSALFAPREGSSAEKALDELETGLLDEQVLDDIATAVI